MRGRLGDVGRRGTDLEGHMGTLRRRGHGRPIMARAGTDGGLPSTARCMTFFSVGGTCLDRGRTIGLRTCTGLVGGCPRGGFVVAKCTSGRANSTRFGRHLDGLETRTMCGALMSGCNMGGSRLAVRCGNNISAVFHRGPHLDHTTVVHVTGWGGRWGREGSLRFLRGKSTTVSFFRSFSCVYGLAFFAWLFGQV